MCKKPLRARRFVCAAAVLAAGLGQGLPAPAQSSLVDPRSIAPFVPAPWEAVDRMLELAAVTENDMVYDLGSGDGRILVRAAKNFGARAVGFEINRDLIRETESAIQAAGVENLAEVHEKNIFDADLSAATVITVYLLGSSCVQLKPKFELELRPDTRLVSYRSSIPGWKAAKTETIAVSGREQKIYLYILGKQHQPD